MAFRVFSLSVRRQLVEMTQEQWDIYKLDLDYECVVRKPSQLTLIQPVAQQHQFPQPTQPIGKRQIGSHSPPPKRSMPPPQNHLVSEDESCDEEEVESIVTNDEPSHPRRESIARERRERLNKERNERREKIARKMEFFPANYENQMDIYPDGPTFDRPRTPDQSVNTPKKGKRKGEDHLNMSDLIDNPLGESVIDTSWSPDRRAFDELGVRSAAYYMTTSATKRSRTIPPVGLQRDLRQKRAERSKRKQQRRVAEAEARRWEREKQLLDEIMEDIPQPGTEDYSHNGGSKYSSWRWLKSLCRNIK